MPVRQMTDEERDQIFGNGIIVLGGRRETPPETPHNGPAAIDEKGNPCLDGSTKGDTARST
jgi:hypothetical protein